MQLSDKQKGELIFELSHLFSEFGDSITDEEADLIVKAINTSTSEGLEFIGEDVWPVLFRIFKKYENFDFDTEQGEGE
jgi:hypothetical protein